MKFGEFKELGFPTSMKMEDVLAHALFAKQIDISEVLVAYTKALEAERHKLTSQFEEACICMNMYLSKHWNKKADKEKLNKRIIHIYNKTTTLPRHIYDTEYGYTNADDTEQEQFYNDHYYGPLNRFGL